MHKTRRTLGCVMGGFNSDPSSRSGTPGQSFVQTSRYIATHSSSHRATVTTARNTTTTTQNTKPGHPTRKDTNHHTQSITSQSSSPYHHPQAATTVKKEVVRVSAPQNEEEHKKALPRWGTTYTHKKGQGVKSKITAIPTIHLPLPAGVLDFPRDRPCDKCEDVIHKAVS